jgi:Mg-chelatase subunit ChlD
MSKRTEIIAVIDRSGSMASIRNDAEGGIRNFIREQKEVPGEARMTLVEFNTSIDTVYQAKSLAQAPDYKLEPSGGTALLDAIGTTLNAQGKRIADEKWAELVILVIVTDGEENSSREFQAEGVKQMISHAEGNGWKVVYLGANQDAFTVAKGLGISASTTANYLATAAGTRSAYASASTLTQSLRAGEKTYSLQSIVDKEASKAPI